MGWQRVLVKNLLLYAGLISITFQAQLFAASLEIKEKGAGSGKIKVDGVIYDLPFKMEVDRNWNATLEALPDNHSNFVQWQSYVATTPSFEKYKNPTKINIDKWGAAYVNVVFNSDNYLLIIDRVGNGRVRVNGEVVELTYSVSFSAFSNVQLNAVPNYDWVFNNWSGDHVGNDTYANIIMDSNKRISANFLPFKSHPKDVVTKVGLSAKFSIPLDDPRIEFQWQKNGVDIPEATKADYEIDKVERSDNQSLFRCVITYLGGARKISNSARLTVTD